MKNKTNIKNNKGENKMKNLTNYELNKIRNAVYQISDAFYALKEIKNNNKTHNGDLAKLVHDLKKLVDDGSVGYFTKIL